MSPGSRVLQVPGEIDQKWKFFLYCRHINVRVYLRFGKRIRGDICPCSLIADLRPRFSFNFEAVVISEVPPVLFCLLRAGLRPIDAGLIVGLNLYRLSKPVLLERCNEPSWSMADDLPFCTNPSPCKIRYCTSIVPIRFWPTLDHSVQPFRIRSCP